MCLIFHLRGHAKLLECVNYFPFHIFSVFVIFHSAADTFSSINNMAILKSAIEFIKHGSISCHLPFSWMIDLLHQSVAA